MAGGQISGAVLQGVGGVMSGIGQGISAWKQKKAQRVIGTQLVQASQKLLQLVYENKLDATSALARIDSFFADAGGELREMYEQQMSLGQELINSRMESTIDTINFNLEQQKTRADRQERDYIEQEQKKLDRISKDFKEATTQTRTALSQRRLGASGAMIAAVTKAQETYGNIQTEMQESKSRFIRGIGEQLADVTAASQFQIQQAGTAAQQAGIGLQAQLAGQEAQARMGLAQQQFAAGEGARERAMNLMGQVLQTETEGLTTQAGAEGISVAGAVMSSIGGGLSGMGSGLMGGGR